GAVLPLDAFVGLAGARALAPIFDVAQKHRSHIFVHRGAASADIPGQQPETGAVNPYFGLPPAGAGTARAQTPAADNVAARTALAAKVFGADRILFGTDSGPVATIGPTIASLKQAQISAAEKELIFSGNARRLLSSRGIT